MTSNKRPSDTIYNKKCDQPLFEKITELAHLVLDFLHVKGSVFFCFFLMIYHIYCHIRYAKYNTVNGVEERMLYKAFGIRFDVMVFGQVGFFPPQFIFFDLFVCWGFSNVWL